MKLFKGDTIKKINKLLDNAENRKEKLASKIHALKQDESGLYQAVQDGFNLSIMEDKEPSKKLTSDLEKVREEIRTATFQLSQVDEVVNSELEKAKSEVDKERREFIKDKGEEFRKQFDKMNSLKLQYLESIIEYHKMNSQYARDYWNTFRDIENRVGLRTRDPRDEFHISLNQRYQTERHYNPMVYNDELKEALSGRILPLTEKNRDKYKA